MIINVYSKNATFLRKADFHTSNKQSHQTETLIYNIKNQNLSEENTRNTTALYRRSQHLVTLILPRDKHSYRRRTLHTQRKDICYNCCYNNIIGVPIIHCYYEHACS